MELEVSKKGVGVSCSTGDDCQANHLTFDAAMAKERHLTSS